MRTYLKSLLLLLMISCSSNDKVLNVEVIEAKDYDIPAKFEITYRAIVTDSVYTEKELRNLVASFYDRASQKKSKYHSKPTHIFIFIYRTHPESGGANWVAMQSRVANIDNPIQVRIQ